MPDEEKEEVEAKEEPKGKKPWLLIALVSLISIAVGTGGTFFLLGSKGASETTEDAAPKPEETHDNEASFDARVFDLEPFVVNITGEGYPRYLKLQLALEMDSLSGREEVQARAAQVRDTTILLLSSKRLSDITDFEGKALLKDDLRERLNALLEKGKVKSVLFTEFVVQ